MFYEMGNTDEAMLRELDRVSRIYFRDAIPNNKYRAWVAETPEGRVIAGGGIVVCDWPGHPRESQPRKVLILNMYTEPEFRRRGIAHRLMQTMLDWCRAEGFVYVSLHASNEGRPLYESLGFRPTNEMRLEL